MYTYVEAWQSQESEKKKARAADVGKLLVPASALNYFRILPILPWTLQSFSAPADGAFQG